MDSPVQPDKLFDYPDTLPGDPIHYWATPDEPPQLGYITKVCADGRVSIAILNDGQQAFSVALTRAIRHRNDPSIPRDGGRNGWWDLHPRTREHIELIRQVAELTKLIRSKSNREKVVASTE